jgi:hypothetical protein
MGAMNDKSLNPNFYTFFIAFLFLIFAVLSHISLPSMAYGETGYIEIFQTIIIVSILIMGFIRKRYLVNAYSRFTYWLRQSLVGLLLFEEISYLTANRFAFLDYNLQSELNFHNSSFLVKNLISFNFIGNDSIDLTPMILIQVFLIIFFYAGDRIPFLKQFNIIYLHPLVRVGILFFLFYMSFLFIRNQFAPWVTYPINYGEMIELFLYIVFLMDIVIKSYPRLSANS